MEELEEQAPVKEPQSQLLARGCSSLGLTSTSSQCPGASHTHSFSTPLVSAAWVQVPARGSSTVVLLLGLGLFVGISEARGYHGITNPSRG